MVKAKPLRRRPPGRPKTIYVVMDGSETIVQIYTTMVLAFKHKPADGSIVSITPAILGRYFGKDPVIRMFLETYDGGRWLQLKRKRRSR